MPARIKAKFIEPMLLLRTDKLPEGEQWFYELKLDGYRGIAFRSGRELHLRSRNDNDFSVRYAPVIKGLAKLPADTVIDGEVVAVDEQDRPDFQLLQNHGSNKAPLLYFVFDVMILSGKDLRREPLRVRREILETRVLPKLSEPVRYAGRLDAPLKTLIESVKTEGFEGLVAKRAASVYEAGQRSGAWLKMRVNRGQEFVIGGYTVGNPFDALIFGYYDKGALMYAARTRNGFTPVVRAQLMRTFKRLETHQCPFANLPEKKSGRFGAGLTAKKMVDCRWLTPKLVGQFEFVEWTSEGHLRHTKFVALRDDKDAKKVTRE
jgi:DNA ligase D-like protein (predicted ligase)